MLLKVSDIQVLVIKGTKFVIRVRLAISFLRASAKRFVD